MSRALPALLLAVTLVLTTPARGEDELLLSRPAGDAALWHDTVLLFAPDFRGVSALDTRGQRRWHRQVASDAPGPRYLALLGGGERLAVVLGDHVRLFDPATGAPRGERDAEVFATAGQRGCWLDEAGDACAVSCPCSFQIVRCDTLAAVGPAFASPKVEEADADGSRAPGGGAASCSGRGGALIGRAGGLVIASVPGPRDGRSAFFVPHRLVGVDLTSGQIAWSSIPLGAAWPHAELSGVSPDGATCWIGALDGRLDAFACATGAVRWSLRMPASKGSEPQADLVGPSGAEQAPGLIVRAAGGVERRRLADGHVVWRIDAPGERVVAATAERPVRLAASDSARVVDPETGATRAALPVPSGVPRELARLGEGWLVAAGGELVAYDARGRVRARAPVGVNNAWDVGESAIAVRGRSGVTLYDRENLLAIYALEGSSASVVGLEGALGRGVVALLVHAQRPWDPADPDSFSELRIVRFRDGGGR